MAIQGIDPRLFAETLRDTQAERIGALQEAKDAQAAPEGGFASVLTDAITQARAAESTSSDLSARFANGDASVGLHEVMIASEKSSIAVRYAVTVKNKAIEAYRELMNTPV